VKLHGVQRFPVHQAVLDQRYICVTPFYPKTASTFSFRYRKASLPYTSMRRNTKLLQVRRYCLIFADLVVWQDAKFSPPRFHYESAQRLSRLLDPDRGKTGTCVRSRRYRNTRTPWERKNIVSNATYSTVIVRRYWTCTSRASAQARSRTFATRWRVSARTIYAAAVRQGSAPA
jgi:hypothetical protein